MISTHYFSEPRFLLRYRSVYCILDGRMSHRPRGRAHTCLVMKWSDIAPNKPKFNRSLVGDLTEFSSIRLLKIHLHRTRPKEGP